MRASATEAPQSLGRIYKNGTRSNSKLLYLFIPGGVIFSFLPGLCLPISYVGHPDASHPAINAVLFAMLPVGLTFSAIGHRMARGEWKGVSKQLHAQLAISGAAFMLITARYALTGVHVRLYPAGLVLAISALLLLSRLYKKFSAHEHYLWP